MILVNVPESCFKNPRTNLHDITSQAAIGIKSFVQSTFVITPYILPEKSQVYFVLKHLLYLS